MAIKTTTRRQTIRTCAQKVLIVCLVHGESWQRAIDYASYGDWEHEGGEANVLKGFRVPVGDQFITVYPYLNVSVKDTKNQDSTVKETAIAKMVTTSKGKSRLGASVSIRSALPLA